MVKFLVSFAGYHFTWEHYRMRCAPAYYSYGMSYGVENRKECENESVDEVGAKHQAVAELVRELWRGFPY